MDTRIYELNDGRILGLKAFEVLSFPTATTSGKNQEEAIRQNAIQFTHVLTELHALCGPNVCMELLWIAEKADNQTFSSKIRIFSLIRRIGQDRQLLCKELDGICSDFITALSSRQFHIQETDVRGEEFSGLLASVNDSSVFSVVKREKCISNVNSVYPYYFFDVVAGNNTNNFDSLVSALSQSENCCLSFQLFPVQFTNDELYMINEVSSELGRIMSGTVVNGSLYRDSMAAEPLKVYSYYNEHRNAPMFMYSILAFGERATCASLATKLVSLLQSGTEKVITSDYTCLDLSDEKICLQKQFPYYVWNLNTRQVYHYRNQNLQKVVPLASRLFRLPFMMTAEEAVSFYRLPLFEKSMVALKSNQTAGAQEQFDSSVVGENNIQLGKLISNDGTAISIGSPEKNFTKHALVVGTPGSGKTTFSFNLLLQFAKKDIPFLAVEPTKSEYRAIMDAIPNVQIFTPGNSAVSPYIVNPFIPPKGIRIEQYIPSLASAFKAAFSMPSPLDMIFLKAIRSCYTKYGWKDYSQIGDSDVTLFGLYEFILEFKKLLENTGYSKEVRGNLESAGLLRLMNLIEQNSNIYDTINTVPIEDLLTAPTILELNSIDNAEQKALIMALLLINICIYTKHNQVGDGKLKNVILIDEAHVLLGGGTGGATSEGSPDSQATTIKALQDMIVEIRSYGTSLIIADQAPSKVSREVVANTDIKVAFRLIESAEKELIADSTNMDADAKGMLSRLKPGQAYVYHSRLETPQLVMTEDVREKEGIRLSISDGEVAARSTYWNGHSELLKPYRECALCPWCQKTCDFGIRSVAEYIANGALDKYRKSLKDTDSFKKCIFYLPRLMEEDMKEYSGENLKKLQVCSRIKLYRKILLELPVSMSAEDMTNVLTHFPSKSEK